MNKWIFIFVVLSQVLMGRILYSSEEGSITQDELVRRTQELFDSVAAGNQDPWRKYFAEDALYCDEKGRNMSKEELIADIAPLPKGYTGSIKIVKAKSLIEKDVAILSYDLNEAEAIYGQNLTARYHGTDTWVRRNGNWQIVASQVLRYYEDPAPGKVDPKRNADYTGVYELTRGVTMTVTAQENELYAQRSDRGSKDLLIPESIDIFFRKGVEGRRLFHRNETGQVDAMIDRRNNEDVVWKKLK